MAGNTLVIFTCDNGPWLIFGAHGGSADPLREGKFTTFEGGQRVPCVMKWPKFIPAGETCTEIASTLDLLPTIAKITNSKLPENKIDGHSITDLLAAKKNAKSPTDAFYFYRAWDLEAVRVGKWKLHFPHGYNMVIDSEVGNVHGKKNIKSEIGLALFNLENDISETKNIADKHPDVVKLLKSKADEMRKDLGDGEIKGSGRRDCGWQVVQD